MSATRIRRRLDCALDDRMSHWMASPASRLKRALIDPELVEAKVNQARADDSAKARVPNQQAQVDRARADVKNAQAADAEGKTQTARARVMVADAKRDLDRKTEPMRRELIAKRLRLGIAPPPSFSALGTPSPRSVALDDGGRRRSSDGSGSRSPRRRLRSLYRSGAAKESEP